MDNAKHTPEPWGISSDGYTDMNGFFAKYANICGDGKFVALVAEIEGFDNARRIVACVNACKGIDTEALEFVNDIKEVWSQRNKELETALKQATELREENERLRYALDSAGDFIAQIGYSEEYANFRIE